MRKIRMTADYICPSCKDSGQPCQTCEMVKRDRIAPMLAAMGDHQAMQSKAAQTREMIERLPCQTPEQYEFCGRALHQVQEQLKFWEGKRKRLNRPVLELKREIDSWFTPAVKSFKEALVSLKAKVQVYDARAEQARREALSAIEQAHAVQDQAAVENHAQQLTAPLTLPGVSKRLVWDWRVVDEQHIPREYLAIDGRKVQNAIKSGTRNVPGLEIFQRETVVIRS